MNRMLFVHPVADPLTSYGKAFTAANDFLWLLFAAERILSEVFMCADLVNGEPVPPRDS